MIQAQNRCVNENVGQKCALLQQGSNGPACDSGPVWRISRISGRGPRQRPARYQKAPRRSVPCRKSLRFTLLIPHSAMFQTEPTSVQMFANGKLTNPANRLAPYNYPVFNLLTIQLSPKLADDLPWVQRPTCVCKMPTRSFSLRCPEALRPGRNWRADFLFDRRTGFHVRGVSQQS